MASSVASLVAAAQDTSKSHDEDPEPVWQKPFPIIGKGTFLFNINRSLPFYIRVRAHRADENSTESWIGLTVTKDSVSFLDKISDEAPKLLQEKNHDEFFGTNIGLEPDARCTYWLSYDRDRMVIKYGKGYRMKKTTILEHDYHNLEKDQRERIRRLLFDPKVQRFVELYDKPPWKKPANAPKPNVSRNIVVPVAPPDCGIADVQKGVDFDALTLVSDLPYLVRDSSKVNLFDLDRGKYMYSGSLPRECQALYDNITAADVDLDYQDTDPENDYQFKLSDAIRHSIETEGCLLHDKLKSKAGEFDDPLTTYLRITLGKDESSSPGIPYVLEIWPKGHGSPVHNHGNAYAVIRVLHGGLTIKYYNKVSESILPTNTCSSKDEPTRPLGTYDVKKDDITWISPNWYQTHKLWNDTGDFCATLQCYQYGVNDNMHWPHFDYIESCDIIGEFTPESDFSFIDMYKRVMQEYANRNN